MLTITNATLCFSRWFFFCFGINTQIFCVMMAAMGYNFAQILPIYLHLSAYASYPAWKVCVCGRIWCLSCRSQQTKVEIKALPVTVTAVSIECKCKKRPTCAPIPTIPYKIGLILMRPSYYKLVWNLESDLFPMTEKSVNHIHAFWKDQLLFRPVSSSYSISFGLFFDSHSHFDPKSNQSNCILPRM